MKVDQTGKEKPRPLAVKLTHLPLRPQGTSRPACGPTRHCLLRPDAHRRAPAGEIPHPGARGSQLPPWAHTAHESDTRLRRPQGTPQACPPPTSPDTY